MPQPAVSALRLTWGLALLARPATLSGLAGRGQGQRLAWVVRVLGARQVLQALAERRWPMRGLRRLGALVDGTHAVVMAAVAALSKAARRPALCSSGVALVLCLEQVRLVGAGEGVR